MERREFCRLVAAAATVIATPAIGEEIQESSNQTGDAAQSPAFKAFDSPTQVRDYAEFCSTPANERQFYAFEDGRFIEEKLDEKDWEFGDFQGNVVEAATLPIPGGSWDGVPMDSPHSSNLAGEGPYKPTWDSLLEYEAPEWYLDAKLAIWAHWSPQCVPEAGDWYARYMYKEGSKQYKYHLEHYGHPSKFGYKDFTAQWTLLNWEPDELIQRFKKTGTRLFIALAGHHDGFDTWNSKHHPWNAVNIGPHRDVVGTWAAAARKQGLHFGVSVHQARNWWWFQTSHGGDKTGPMAGVPYDGDLTLADGKGQWWEGLDPQRLYGPKHPGNALPDLSYVRDYYDRTRDLIDQHNPDFIYSDSRLFPLGWAGMNIGAYFYNHNLKTHEGKMEAVINIKDVPDRLLKAAVLDWESGLMDNIRPYPWQAEYCIGNCWHYDRANYDLAGELGGYQHPRDLVHLLIDLVSKNGTMVLNVPGRSDGTIDSKEIAVLDAFTAWMQPNGEAIYDTRPWKVFGEGPGKLDTREFKGDSIKNLGVRDIRFTRNKANTVIYALVLGWPAGEFVVESLGTASSARAGKIKEVQLLGTDKKLKWKQAADGLRVELPNEYRPKADYAAALKIFLT
jgi:alpha-L-fucosidase